MFIIDSSNKYYIDLTMKRRSNGFYCYLKLQVYFDNDGTLYKTYIVVLHKKDDFDSVPFSILVDAIDYFNSIK